MRHRSRSKSRKTRELAELRVVKNARSEHCGSSKCGTAFPTRAILFPVFRSRVFNRSAVPGDRARWQVWCRQNDVLVTSNEWWQGLCEWVTRAQQTTRLGLSSLSKRECVCVCVCVCSVLLSCFHTPCVDGAGDLLRSVVVARFPPSSVHFSSAATGWRHQGFARGGRTAKTPEYIWCRKLGLWMVWESSIIIVWNNRWCLSLFMYSFYYAPAPNRRGIKRWCCLTSVCLTSDVCLSPTLALSGEQRGLGRLKLSPVTRTPLSRSEGQRSRSPGRFTLYWPPC